MKNFNKLVDSYPKASKVLTVMGVLFSLYILAGIVVIALLFDPLIWIGAFLGAKISQREVFIKQLIAAYIGALTVNLLFVLAFDPRHPMLFARFVVSLFIAYFATDIFNSFSFQGAMNSLKETKKFIVGLFLKVSNKKEINVFFSRRNITHYQSIMMRKIEDNLPVIYSRVANLRVLIQKFWESTENSQSIKNKEIMKQSDEDFEKAVAQLVRYSSRKIVKSDFIEKMNEAIPAHLKLTQISDSDSSILAHEAIVHIITKVLDETTWDQDNLDDDQQFTLMLIVFAISSEISHHLNAPFEIMTGVLYADIVRRGIIDEIGLHEIGDLYNQMASSRDRHVLSDIGRMARIWIMEPADMEPILRLAGILQIISNAVVDK